VLKANLTPSYTEALDMTALEIGRKSRKDEMAFRLEIEAAYERICETPDIGRSLRGAMHSHRLMHFRLAIIYEVTDDEIVFLYLAPRR
jgi:plasmid stabilization system protein ParE